MHALARHFSAIAFGARGHLVNFVNEHNAVLLEHVQRLRLDVFLVDQFGRFFINQQFHRFGDLELAGLALGLTHLTEHATQLLGHFFHASRTHDLQLRRWLGYLYFNLALSELPLAQLLAKDLPRRALWLVTG